MKIDKSFVAIVTGGASGLGAGTVELLRCLGARVVIADINEELGKQVAKKHDCDFVKTDVGNEKEVVELIKFVVEKHKRIDAVINSAGISTMGTTIFSKGVISSTEMERIMRTNVIGTLNVCKYAAKVMSEQEEVNGERGVLINVASVAGYEGQKGQVIYSASKGALIGMTLPMARDLGKFKIRVMTIAPGIFDTPMGKNVPKKVVEVMLAQTPLNRVGVPSQFALCVEAIIRNPYATGTTWRLDGGIKLPSL